MVRWLRLNVQVLLGVAAGTVVTAAIFWMWLDAQDQTKQDDLSSSLRSGMVVATALFVYERRGEIGRRRSQYFTQFSSPTGLPGVHARGADLRNVSVDGKDMTRAVLAYANLREAQFTSCDMQGVDLRRADLRRGDFWFSNMAGADLRRANVRAANLEGGNLHVARCTGADFSRANLVDVHFDRADLADVDFRGAIFAGRSGGGGPCKSASMQGCWLYGADFREAIFVVKDRDPRFEGDVVGIDLTDALANGETKWPAGFDPRKAGVVVLPGKQRDHGEPAWRDPGVQDLTTGGLDSWPIVHTNPYEQPAG